MVKSRIYVVIGLMVMAIVGLFVVQSTYVKNTITLKEAQFRYNVNAALSEVSERLEHHDAMERMKSNRKSQNALSKIDSIQRMVTNGWSKEFGFYQQDTIILSDAGEVRMTYTKTSGSSGSPQLSTSFVRPAGMDNSSNAIMMDMLSGLMDMDLFKPYEQKLDLKVVDSCLNESLARYGIDAEHELAVFDGYGRPLLFSDSSPINELSEISASPYAVRLYPKELFGDSFLLKVHFPSQKSYVLTSLWPLLMTSSGLILIIMCAFAFTIVTIFRQKKVQEIKNDFINNMTHELKTPISTISLACEALSDPDMRKRPESRDRFVGMIQEENSRLGSLVENVLRTAVIDRGQMRLNIESVDINSVINEVVKNFDLQFKKKSASLQLQLDALPSEVKGDRVHLTNVIFNLVDNALKYSPIEPQIEISSRSANSSLILCVKDNGIGISRENQMKVFDKLYRVPTGNTHDVKGFGLGLSYVKAVIEKHGGTVGLESSLGGGSSFIIEIPYCNEHSE